MFMDRASYRLRNVEKVRDRRSSCRQTFTLNLGSFVAHFVELNEGYYWLKFGEDDLKTGGVISQCVGLGRRSRLTAGAAPLVVVPGGRLVRRCRARRASSSCRTFLHSFYDFGVGQA